MAACIIPSWLRRYSASGIPKRRIFYKSMCQLCSLEGIALFSTYYLERVTREVNRNLHSETRLSSFSFRARRLCHHNWTICSVTISQGLSDHVWKVFLLRIQWSQEVFLFILTHRKATICIRQACHVRIRYHVQITSRCSKQNNSSESMSGTQAVKNNSVLLPRCRNSAVWVLCLMAFKSKLCTELT